MSVKLDILFQLLRNVRMRLGTLMSAVLSSVLIRTLLTGRSYWPWARKLGQLSVKLFLYPLIVSFSIWTLLAGAIYIGNWAKLIENIEHNIHQLTGYEIQISERVQLSFYPHLDLYLSDISVKKPDDQKSLLHIKNITLTPDYLALFSGNIRISSLRCRDAEITLRRTGESSPNWMPVFATTTQIDGSTNTQWKDLFADTVFELENATLRTETGDTQTPVLREITVPSAHYSPVLHKFGATLLRNNTTIRLFGDIRRATDTNPATLSLDISHADGALLQIQTLYDPTNQRWKGNLNGQWQANQTALWSFVSPYLSNTLAGLSTMTSDNGNILLSSSLQYDVIGNKLSLDTIKWSTKPYSILGNISLEPGFFTTINGQLIISEINLSNTDALKNSLLQLQNLFTKDGLAAPVDWLPGRDWLGKVTLSAPAITIGDRRADVNIGLEWHDGKTFTQSTAHHLLGDETLSINGSLATSADTQQTLITDLTLNIKGQKTNASLVTALSQASTASSNTYEAEIRINADRTMMTIPSATLHAGNVNISAQAQKIFTDQSLNRAAIRLENLNLDQLLGNTQFDLHSLVLPFTKDGLLASVMMVNSTYKSQPFESISATANFKEKTIAVNQLAFQSGANKGVMRLDLSNEGLESSFTTDITMESANTEFLKTMLGVNTALPIPSDAQTSPIKIIDNPALSSYKGDAKLHITDLKTPRFTIKNLHSDIGIQAGVATIRSLQADVFAGTIDMTGAIGLDRPYLNVSYTLPNADVRQTLQGLFGVDSVYGRASFSGALNMNGLTYQNWLESMQGVVNFISRGLVIQGFDLPGFATGVENIPSLRDLRNWMRTVLSSGETPIEYTAGKAIITQGTLQIENVPLLHPNLSSASMNVQLQLPTQQLKADYIFNVKAGGSMEGIRLTLSSSGDVTSAERKWNTQAVEKFWEDRFFKH